MQILTAPPFACPLFSPDSIILFEWIEVDTARRSGQKPVENSGVCSELAIECRELAADGSEFAIEC